jgi:peptidyl-tRNA hydrolase, PTH1 family
MTPPFFLRSLFPQRRRGDESGRLAPEASAQTATRIRLIVGLGNPGGEHSHTRHNVGFWCVNRLGRRYGVPLKTHTSLVTMGQGQIEGSEVILAKPRTYVNRSGEAVAALVRRYKVSPAELLVVCDSLDLPVGAVRVRPQGGHGGHKGLQSIIQRLGVDDFPRIRIGIGRPVVDGEPAYDPEVIAEYVLSDPPPGERRLLDEAVARAIDVVASVMTEGLEAAMNQFNR